MSPSVQPNRWYWSLYIFIRCCFDCGCDTITGLWVQLGSISCTKFFYLFSQNSPIDLHPIHCRHISSSKLTFMLLAQFHSSLSTPIIFKVFIGWLSFTHQNEFHIIGLISLTKLIPPIPYAFVDELFSQSELEVDAIVWQSHNQFHFM